MPTVPVEKAPSPRCDSATLQLSTLNALPPAPTLYILHQAHTHEDSMAPVRKIICFSGTYSLPLPRSKRPPLTRPDFDGTIFKQDTGHVLVDNLGCGSKKRAILDHQIKSGERSFREVSEEMWGSLNIPFEDGFEAMEQNMEMDPYFEEFYRFCKDNRISFNVISAGLKPVLRTVLATFLGAEVSLHSQIKDEGVADESIVITYPYCRQRCSTRTQYLPVATDLAP